MSGAAVQGVPGSDKSAWRGAADALISGSATPEDDRALQELHAEVAIPGHIGLRFSRKPSFFAGPESLGAFDVLVVKDGFSDKAEPDHLLGMLSRSVRPVYVQGSVQQAAFINHLRLKPGCQSIAVLRRLCAELYELQRNDPVDLTLATISAGNRTALGILVERPLKCFPRLIAIDELITFSIPARNEVDLSTGPQFNRGCEDRPLALLPSAVGKNFFPAIGPWSWKSLRAHGLCPEHMLSFSEHGEAIFHGALWDQSASKQVEVTDLSPFLSALRPFYNMVARARGRGGIPAIGEQLRVLTLSFLGVKDNSPAAFRAFLPALARETHRRGSDQFVVTLSVRDPLIAVVRRFAAMSYRSTVYVVTFDHQVVKSALTRDLCYLDPGFL